MRSRNTSDKLRSQQIMEEPAKEGLIEKQVKFEIGRLTVILRNPVCTEEEKARTQSQFGDYQEMVVIAPGTSAAWLQQIYLLADPDEDVSIAKRACPHLGRKEVDLLEQGRTGSWGNHDHVLVIAKLRLRFWPSPLPCIRGYEG